jgi:DNA (cytosine-5)-methyltransferase 1
MSLSVLEICAGCGGQASGLEQAGFDLAAAIEIDQKACATLRANRPGWEVIEDDVRNVRGRDYRGIDLLAGGVPCPPFSIAGKQLGQRDERDLFPEALRLTAEARPSAILLENVKGLSSERFALYRRRLLRAFSRLGYDTEWQVLNASSHGVPQLRPRFILVAVRQKWAERFVWPDGDGNPLTVGQTLRDLMAARRWPGASAWSRKANGIAPTLVGGSKKHGGPDLGPTRAKRDWARLGVDGHGLADEPPGRAYPKDGIPRLTVRMTARLQGFPDEWEFCGGKTAAYRQVGNAFPPPVAKAVAESIRAALRGEARPRRQAHLFHGRADAVKDPAGSRLRVKKARSRISARQ